MTPIEIKKLRLKLGLSQNDFARKIGIKRKTKSNPGATISNWERGISKPSVFVINAIKKLIKYEERDFRST